MAVAVEAVAKQPDDVGVVAEGARRQALFLFELEVVEELVDGRAGGRPGHRSGLLTMRGGEREDVGIGAEIVAAVLDEEPEPPPLEGGEGATKLVPRQPAAVDDDVVRVVVASGAPLEAALHDVAGDLPA